MKTSYSKQPIIGISATRFTVETGSFLGCEKSAAGQGYIDAVVQAGGIPLLLPIISNSEAIARQMEGVDGLLLTGGYDVHPLYYQEEPHHLLKDICPERDEYELELVRLAYEKKKPIFGICRGLQILNVAFGGTLYQDLSQYQEATLLKHSQEAKTDTATHTIDIERDTLLHQIFQADTVTVNSYHHQAINNLAPLFKINAKSRDGLIEGIEASHSFIVGVQWHPECMFQKHPSMLKLFQAFIEASKNK